MKQKILFLCFIIFMSSGLDATADSTVVGVQALKAISTANPPQMTTVKLLEPLVLDNELYLKAGVEINGNIVEVKTPKRLKRNAKFSIQPTSYKDETGKVFQFNSNIIATYSKPLNKAKIAKNATLGIGNFFVKGLSMGVAAVEGAVENEQGNRLKSSAQSLYQASPISYAEKGKNIEIHPSDVFYLKFKN